MSNVERFASLFGGREHVYGGGTDGRSFKLTQSWRDVAAGHLHHEGKAIGVYPMWPEPCIGSHAWVCRWGCVDFDIKSDHHKSYDYETEDEAHIAAINLVNVLDAFKIEAWIERTRSCGRHVWVFATEPLAASFMRRALIVACQIAGVPIREVNPKSEGFGDSIDTLGNYVRLPYPWGHGCGKQVMIEPEPNWNYIQRDDFLSCVEPTSIAAFIDLAARYIPPVVVPLDIQPVEYGHLNDPYLRTAIDRGPFEGGDRSAWLIGIGRKAAKRGHDQSEVMAWITLADDACGKYVGRSDRQRRLDELVRIAFT